MVKTLLVRVGLITLSLVILSGCGVRLLNSREKNPVLEDYVGGNWHDPQSSMLGSLSTLASYRTVIVRMPEGAIREEGRVGMFCAEPPPDALESIASSFAGAVDVTGKGSGELQTAFGRGMSPLFIRSQGVQLYRDGMYNNCQAYLNGIRTKDEYIAYSDFLLRNATTIIEVEAKQFEYKITGTLGPTPDVATTSSGINSNTDSTQ